MDAKTQRKIERVCELAERRGTIVAELQEIDTELAILCGDNTTAQAKVVKQISAKKVVAQMVPAGINAFRCENGHEFQTGEKKLDAVCPVCQSIHVQDVNPLLVPTRVCGCGPRGPHRADCKNK